MTDEWAEIILEDVLDADIVTDPVILVSTGAHCWYDADSYDPVQGIWHDLSGNGNHARMTDG